MIFSEFGKGVRNAEHYARECERYLRSAGNPGNIQLACLSYANAVIIASLVGYGARDKKQQDRYATLNRRLGAVKKILLETGAREIDGQITVAQKEITDAEAMSKQMGELGMNTKPDYGLPAIMLNGAALNFDCLAQVVGEAKDEETVAVLGPTAQRIVELREELESKNKK